MSITRRSFPKTTLAAGAALSTITPASTLLAKSRKKYPKSRRVLVVTFDGLRVDGFQQARTPNIDALIADGSVSWTTRDVMPSITLPNYTFHLSGARLFFVCLMSISLCAGQEKSRNQFLNDLGSMMNTSVLCHIDVLAMRERLRLVANITY